jgi:hypothetical protein
MIVINPGSGPVSVSTRENADKNMQKFLEDTESDSFEFTKEEEDGRFTYLLKKGSWTSEIMMPGLALDQVRYIGGPDQNIGDFPRLYVDGSSWVWKYARNVWEWREEKEGEE